MPINRLLISLALSLLPVTADAAPTGSRLLAMVPGSAQIVTGLKLTSQTEATPSQSLVIYDNNVDFADWLALVGVDPTMSGTEVIEVAASSPRGELAERLLLVDGTFDAEHIFRAALKTGASAAEYSGIRVVIVLPFAREQGARVGVRWLAFPDDQTALFGTPLLVQQALDRRAAHTLNPALVDRLKELRSGVDGWSLINMPVGLFKRHLGGKYHPLEMIMALTRSDDVLVAFRYGRSSTRIDFTAHVERDFSVPAITSADRLSRAQFDRIAVERGRVTGTLTVTNGRKNASPKELAIR